MTHYGDWKERSQEQFDRAERAYEAQLERDHGVDDDERADDYEPGDLDGPDPDDGCDNARDQDCCYECWQKNGGDGHD